ncbi:hypothetical protein BDZ89DRAFT_1064990 [Hymenopellis radicata]|nr:hypothetical protein BDZ89DRAFT_1064990 [Hymenopellis radicata]
MCYWSIYMCYYPLNFTLSPAAGTRRVMNTSAPKQPERVACAQYSKHILQGCRKIGISNTHHRRATSYSAAGSSLSSKAINRASW